jgi:hypothetical protein
MIITAVLCSIGYYLVNHSFLANNICRIGHLILPFVLTGLGIYIMVGEFINKKVIIKNCIYYKTITFLLLTFMIIHINYLSCC